MALEQLDTDIEIILKIQQNIKLTSFNFGRAHIAIHGNEMVDCLAKGTTSLKEEINQEFFAL